MFRTRPPLPAAIRFCCHQHQPRRPRRPPPALRHRRIPQRHPAHRHATHHRHLPREHRQVRRRRPSAASRRLQHSVRHGPCARPGTQAPPYAGFRRKLLRNNVQVHQHSHARRSHRHLWSGSLHCRSPGPGRSASPFEVARHHVRRARCLHHLRPVSHRAACSRSHKEISQRRRRARHHCLRHRQLRSRAPPRHGRNGIPRRAPRNRTLRAPHRLQFHSRRLSPLPIPFSYPHRAARQHPPPPPTT